MGTRRENIHSSGGTSSDEDDNNSSHSETSEISRKLTDLTINSPENSGKMWDLPEDLFTAYMMKHHKELFEKYGKGQPNYFKLTPKEREEFMNFKKITHGRYREPQKNLTDIINEKNRVKNEETIAPDFRSILDDFSSSYQPSTNSLDIPRSLYSTSSGCSSMENKQPSKLSDEIKARYDQRFKGFTVQSLELELWRTEDNMNQKEFNKSNAPMNSTRYKKNMEALNDLALTAAYLKERIPKMTLLKEANKPSKIKPVIYSNTDTSDPDAFKPMPEKSNNFAMTWKRLEPRARKFKFSLNDYYYYLSLALPDEQLSVMESLRNVYPFEDIIEELHTQFGLRKTLRDHRNEIEHFKVKPGEPINKAMSRYRYLLTTQPDSYTDMKIMTKQLEQKLMQIVTPTVKSQLNLKQLEYERTGRQLDYDDLLSLAIEVERSGKKPSINHIHHDDDSDTESSNEHEESVNSITPTKRRHRDHEGTETSKKPRPTNNRSKSIERVKETITKHEESLPDKQKEYLLNHRIIDFATKSIEGYKTLILQERNKIENLKPEDKRKIKTERKPNTEKGHIHTCRVPPVTNIYDTETEIDTNLLVDAFDSNNKFHVLDANNGNVTARPLNKKVAKDIEEALQNEGN